MSPKDETIAAAWAAAENDLKIGIKSHYCLHWKGRELVFAAWAPDFGRPKGCLFLAVGSEFEDLRTAAAVEADFFVSHLRPEAFAAYKRPLFIETLSDMGYYGPSAKKPAWYTGDAW